MTFVSRLALVVISAVAATVVAVAVICFGASERVSIEIERARVANLLTTLRTATEANLAIGLSLDQISPLQARIEREKASDPSVLAVDVFNANGRALYSTDRGLIGENVPPGWAERLKGSGIWQTTERGDTVFGTHFENDLGVAGGLAVTVSDRSRIARSDRLGVSLLGLALGLLAGGAVVAGSAAALVAYAMSRPFDKVAQILRGDVAAPSPQGTLPQLAVRTQRSWLQAEVRVDRGLGQLGALDDAS